MGDEPRARIERPRCAAVSFPLGARLYKHAHFACERHKPLRLNDAPHKLVIGLQSIPWYSKGCPLDEHYEMGCGLSEASSAMREMLCLVHRRGLHVSESKYLFGGCSIACTANTARGLIESQRKA